MDDAVTLGLGVVVLVVFLYMIKVVMDLQSAISASMGRVEQKLDLLEETASGVTSDVAGIKRSMNEKVDRDYVEKRLKGLSELFRGAKGKKR